MVINLDKDREACALATEVRAERKLGFELDTGGVCRPVDDGPARDKFLTGLFDDESLRAAHSDLSAALLAEIAARTFTAEQRGSLLLNPEEKP